MQWRNAQSKSAEIHAMFYGKSPETIDNYMVGRVF